MQLHSQVLGIETSTYEFGEDKIQSITVNITAVLPGILAVQIYRLKITCKQK